MVPSWHKALRFRVARLACVEKDARSNRFKNDHDTEKDSNVRHGRVGSLHRTNVAVPPLSPNLRWGCRSDDSSPLAYRSTVESRRLHSLSPHAPSPCFRVSAVKSSPRMPSAKMTRSAIHPYTCRGFRRWCSGRRGGRRLCGRAYGGRIRRPLRGRIRAGMSGRISRR